MNDLRAVGGLACDIRSVISIVLARPKRKHVSKRPASRCIIDSLVYNAPLFIGQLDRCFVVPVEIISAAAATTTTITKVADAE